MKYCARCLYSEIHPLNITFDDRGVCSGCRVHEEKDQLDWNKRWDLLVSLTQSFKSDKGKLYDCIIPVSGARDSFFIVHTVKKVLGLNPLLVTYNRHFNTVAGISNIAYLRTLMDCDLLTLTVRPELIKKITKITLDKRASIFWHVLAGQTVYPVNVAVGYKIPLIIWGVHQGCDQVGMYSHTDEVEMTRKYRKEHDLMGIEAEDLISDHLSEQELGPFLYPSDKEIEQVGVRGIYLSNYIRWDTKKQHEEMLKLYNYQVGSVQRTFDKYNDVDCLHYAGLHDYIKYLKFGYGKVTDHVCREIRLKRLTRVDGIRLINKYKNILPKDTKLFCEWLGISEQELFDIINQHRDTRVWTKDSSGKWKNCLEQETKLAKDQQVVALDVKQSCHFIENSEIKLSSKLLNKGFTDIKKMAFESNDY